MNALLRPDMPRNRNKIDHSQTSSYHPAFAETISVTRSLLYPNLPLSDILKEGKEISDSSVAVLPRRPAHNFASIPHNVGLYNMHLHQQQHHQNTPSPSTTPAPPTSATTTMTMMSVKDNVDFLDRNRNFLAGSLYLSLGAVQAAAAAAIANPTSTGNTGTLKILIRYSLTSLIRKVLKRLIQEELRVRIFSLLFALVKLEKLSL